MSKILILMVGFAVGLALFFSSCGGDDMEDLPSINIPLGLSESNGSWGLYRQNNNNSSRHS